MRGEMPIHFLLFFTSWLYSLWLHYVCSVVKEELAEDDALLPQVNGRVVCWVSTSLYYGVCVMSMCYVVLKFKAYFVKVLVITMATVLWLIADYI